MPIPPLRSSPPTFCLPSPSWKAYHGSRAMALSSLTSSHLGADKLFRDRNPEI